MADNVQALREYMWQCCTRRETWCQWCCSWK